VVRAHGFIADKPDEARAIGAESAIFEREWKDFSFVVELEQSLIVNLEDQVRWMRKRMPGGGTMALDFMNFIHTDGLRAVRPEAIGVRGG